MDGAQVSCSGLQICTTKICKMSCVSTQFQVLLFCGPHANPHIGRDLSKHNHLRLDPKLGNGKCEIRQIPCAWIACTNMLDKPWVIGSDPTRKLRYQPVEDYKYCPVLGSFNNWNITQLTNEKTTNEYFDAVHKVV